MKEACRFLLPILVLSSAIILVSCFPTDDPAAGPAAATNQFAFGSEVAPSPLSAAERHSLMRLRSPHREGHGLLQGAGPKPWIAGFPTGPDSVMLMNNDGSGTVAIATLAGQVDSVQEGYDGKKGVASVLDDAGNYQIVYVDLSDQNNPVVTQLTTEAVDHVSPQLSWDGTTVVYVKLDSVLDSDYDHVVLMTATGGAETMLSTTFEPDCPTFAPNGKILLGNLDDGTIYVMNADASGITQLTTPNTGMIDRRPSVSPDGTTFTFVRYDPIIPQIWTANIDGRNAKQITTDGESADPMFVNNKIVYLGWRGMGGNFQVYSMNPDGTNQTALTTDTDWHYFDWD